MQPSTPTPDRHFDQPLRCVHSGYLSDGCSCKATVPTSVVTAAWHQEPQRSRDRDDQFFTFTWSGGQWLAYGLRDGSVRGVYCAKHNAERAQRAGGHALRVAA